MKAPPRRKRRSVRQVVSQFYWKAYKDNLTGLSAMVAYNLLLSIFPLALLALFIAGKILQSAELEDSVLKDLRHLFPTTAEKTLENLLARVRNSSAGTGIGALVSSIWIGSSFWGALDTAFCRIYHVRCRTWVEQKRFALAMLVVVLLFMAATVAVPTLQSILVGGATNLPFGLKNVHDLIFAVSLLAGLMILFGILCVIYWSVPNRLVPWRAIWPGALAATLAIGVIDYAFPLYLTNINSIAKLGTTLIFIVIVLIWFYAIAIIVLGGAVINATRFEIYDTGELKLSRPQATGNRPQA
jgi:membrane protein